MSRWLRRNRGALLGVVLPTALVAFYQFVVAADRYASQASFVVRSASAPRMGGLAGLLQGTPSGGGQEDVYAVQTFATSRDALAQLSETLDLQAIYSRPEADLLSRYPNPIDWDNQEDFHRYFQRRVEVVYDTTKGLSTLTVQAFRPADAQQVANALLTLSEQLVNRLNERARRNAVRDAEADVAAAESEVVGVQRELLDYRNSQSLLDPGKTSAAVFESVARTEAELVASRTRLAELQRSAPQSPLRADLESHIRALEVQLARQSARLTGSDAALAPKLSAYEQLLLRKDFVTQKLASALASLEAARTESRQQQIYLERVVNTSLPDRALYPRRVRAVLIAFVSFFLIYTIGRLLLSGVREHAQQ